MQKSSVNITLRKINASSFMLAVVTMFSAACSQTGDEYLMRDHQRMFARRQYVYVGSVH